ncbi:MAG: stage II sporulation protein P [Anaerovoracaceae bacterium]|jgi:stage II sporulation protein P
MRKKYRLYRHHKRSGKNRKILLFILLFWCLSGITTLALLNGDTGIKGQDFREEIGKQCLAYAYPIISRSTGTQTRESLIDEEGNNLTESTDQETTIEENQKTIEMEQLKVVDTESSDSPLVLIYHTHATEAYQPVSNGNFHSVSETATVREVGNVLESSLKAKGIAVIHNKTLHDSPSYNKSYSRSVETVKNILAANPSIKIVIDLHRDAAGYSGNKSHTFKVDGKKAAQFSLVVGQGNDNVKELTGFANNVIQKANEMYPGFCRGIIKKEYKYNQYVSNQCLLLEMGNNQNNIEEVKLSAEYLAEALAKVIEDI